MASTQPTPSPSSRATTPAIPAEIVLAPPGARCGKFVTAQKLGAGAMGEVWKAWDTILNRWVALKFLKGGDDEEIARFEREARTAGKLSHPNVASIFEVGIEAGPSSAPDGRATEGRRHYIAMQFVDGTTLGALSRRDRRALVAHVRDASRAVAAAHDLGIVHRDLKPENLMVDRAGRVFVMDFGLARAVEGASQISISGVVVGTPAYMAPEQARGERVDARSDVYSLGMTLYDLMTDARPFAGSNVYEVLRRLQNEEPRPPRALNPRIAKDLETIILKCLEKDAARRYTTAHDLADDLDRFLRGEPIDARPPSVAYLLRRQLAKRKGLGIAALASLLVIGILVAVLLPRLQRTAQQTGETQQAVLDRMRQTSRTCLGAALEMRKTGNLPGMRAQAAKLESVCRDVIATFPGLAEPHYHLGRIKRALLDSKAALAEQNEAIKLDPSYAPARYERAVLSADRIRSSRRASVAWMTSEHVEALRSGPRRDPPAPEQIDPLLADLAAAAGLGDAEAAVVQGLRAWARRDFSEARLQLAKAKLDEAVDALGELEKDTGRYEDAIRVFSAGIEEDRGFRPYYIGRADARIALGFRKAEAGTLFTEAVRDLDALLTLEPGDLDLLQTRGAMRVAAGLRAMRQQRVLAEEFKAAIADFDRVLAREPANATAQIGRAGALLNWAIAQSNTAEDPVPLFEAARDALRKIRDERAGFAAQLGLGVLERVWGAWLAERGFDPDEHFAAAIKAMNEVVGMLPTSAMIVIRRGKTWLDWGATMTTRGLDPSERYRAALRDFDEALRNEPQNDGALMAKGAALANWAGEQLMRGMDSSETYRDAIASLDASLAIQPEDDEAWLSRGLAKGGLGELRARSGGKAADLFEEALKDYDQALKLNPDRPETWMRRGLTKRKLAGTKRDPAPLYRDAIADISEALARGPWMAGAWEARGNVRISLGRHVMASRADASAFFRDAVSDFDEAIQRAPGREPLWRERGVAKDFWGVSLAQRGKESWPQFEGALTDFNQAAELNPKDADTFWYRGNNRFNRGIYRENQGQSASAEFRAALADYDLMESLEPKLADQVKAQRRGAKAYLAEHP